MRQRGSLTIWFCEEAIAAERAEPHTTCGGQAHCSALAIKTALTLRVVFRLALRQTEGLIGSILQLLGLDLAVPDHSTLSRRAETGQILTSELTTSDVDDGSQVKPLLDRTSGPLASFIGDGAYDRAGIYATITKRPPEADVIVPPRSTAVPSEMAASTSTQRDRHLQSIADHGCMGWQKRSGYTRRALVESSIDRFKLVTGNTLRSRMDRRRAIEIAIAV